MSARQFHEDCHFQCGPTSSLDIPPGGPRTPDSMTYHAGPAAFHKRFPSLCFAHRPGPPPFQHQCCLALRSCEKMKTYPKLSSLPKRHVSFYLEFHGRSVGLRCATGGLSFCQLGLLDLREASTLCPFGSRLCFIERSYSTDSRMAVRFWKSGQP